ncbi:MAG TPA: ribosome small subunit-dependent GTPase A [Cytophagaceae bacterium]|nr:ribosome small subunit-dependent GTPase A [Cytophagaceae bacterium]
MKGTIVRSTGSWYDIAGEDGKIYKGRLRGKFKIRDLKVTNPLAVGDLVVFEFESEQSETVAIQEICPRRNYIIRKSVHKSAHGHLIASNIDQSVLVVTLAMPRTSPGFVDRFLVSAETFRIPAVLVFNKVDLYDTESKSLLEEFSSIYSDLGYTCINTSTLTGEGVETLREHLKNKTSLLSGHSGVGKSSLVNLLIPGLELATTAISGFADKGVHTTTFSERFVMEENSYLIDTPGIKELGLFEIGDDELSHYFPEMRAMLNECKFNDCRHVNEPGCAVIEKVKKGEISLSRYESYLSILLGEDNRK